jgi:hypothetical protein
LKDNRYKAIKSLIESKSLTGLKDVFTILPYSLVRQDLKINYNTLRRRVTNGSLLTMKDIVAMASLIEVDPVEIFRLSLNDITKSPKAGTRKR